MDNKKSKAFPYLAVIITALVTCILTVLTALFSGFPGRDNGDMAVTAVSGPEVDETKEDGKGKIAYWRAPMNPKEVYDKPGKSAMGMELVPVYEESVKGGVEVKINPVTQQNMGVRTAPVIKGPIVHTIRTFGHLTYDETRTAQISPRYSGWIEKLYVNFKGQAVKKGEPLFKVYSPELVTAQEEYLEVFRNMKRTGNFFDKRMLDSVKRRLVNYNVSSREIKKIESQNRARNTTIIRSPFAGIVTEMNVLEGGYFKAGTIVYTISDLSKIWVDSHIYEYELSLIKPGLNAEMNLPYHPGKIYYGKVTFVYPYMQRQTRDVVIRLEFDNPGLLLKPDMYANVRIKTEIDKEGLIIPSEALIRSGEQNIVFVTRGKGTFSPRNVTPGISIDEGRLQILAGLKLGEQVVTSGQFLLDSESKLKEAIQKMLEVDTPATDAEPAEEDDFFDDME